MRISKFLAGVFVRDPFLYRVGLFMFILAVILIGPLLFDDRLVLGINPWLKPIKFCISVGIYLFTIAWFLDYIKANKRIKKWISYLTGSAMVLEILIVIFQAMRGVRSHFNDDTAFDELLFGIMGLMIALTTLLIVIYFFTLFVGKSSISGPYRLSILISILIFLVASSIGGVMISQGGHTVGAIDGSPGILFFNWSKRFGDLRIAHFIGLHAIQVIPFSCYWLLKKIPNANITYVLVGIMCLMYSGVLYMLYAQAKSGYALFPQ